MNKDIIVLFYMLDDLYLEQNIFKRELKRRDLSDDSIDRVEEELKDIGHHIEMTWQSIHNIQRRTYE